MAVEEQGVFPERYQVIPRVLILLFNDQNVLLLKGAPDKKIWPNMYNGLGGHVERGESILEAANRELTEEAGISDVDLFHCGTILVDTNSSIGIGMFVFKGFASKIKRMISSVEGELEWLDIRLLHEKPLVKDLYKIIPKVYLHQENQIPFSGKSFYQEDELLIQFD